MSNPAHSLTQAERSTLPVSALLALALAGFITILTEALPAGLLPQISHSLSVSPAQAGQLVTLYALGSLLAAIPLTIATQSRRRRPLLLTAIAGFIVANTLTAVSVWYPLTLIARFLAGVSAGLLWALIAGYAARMVQPALKGRAIALAMVGTPLALSIGVPLGTFVSEIIGWRSCFIAITAICLLLMLWIVVSVPDFPGQPTGRHYSLPGVLKLAGVRPVLAATLIFVLAHNIIYTYITPFLEAARMADSVSAVLLVFGIASLLGIWLVGLTIDRWLRAGALLATLLFALAMILLHWGDGSTTTVYAAVVLWGLAFGGAPALFQTALAKSAGDAADVAQSMLVTAWNIAIAGGGAAGAAILALSGPALFSPVLVVLLALTWAVIWRARHEGFTARERG